MVITKVHQPFGQSQVRYLDVSQLVSCLNVTRLCLRLSGPLVSYFWLVLGYLFSQVSQLESRIGQGIRPHMEGPVRERLPLTTHNRIRLGWSRGPPWLVTHVLANVLLPTFPTKYFGRIIWNVYLLSQGSSLCPWTLLNLHDHFK